MTKYVKRTRKDGYVTVAELIKLLREEPQSATVDIVGDNAFSLITTRWYDDPRECIVTLG